MSFLEGLLVAILVALTTPTPTPAQDAHAPPEIDCAGLFPAGRCEEIVRRARLALALDEGATDAAIASARLYAPVNCWQGTCETRTGADVAVVAFFDGKGQPRALVMVGTTGIGTTEHAWPLPADYAERLGLPPPPSPLAALLIGAVAVAVLVGLAVALSRRARPPAHAEPGDAWATPQ